ncbi:MAG: hypothetical protein P8179_24060 [Candidatus Thiodiazotropha sp.]
MREKAIAFRDSMEEFHWLSGVIIDNGLSTNNGILVSLNSCIEQGPVEECNAIWVSSVKLFYEIDVILKYGTQEIIEVEGFCDITDVMEFNAHQRGRGKTFGVLALELVEELL